MGVNIVCFDEFGDSCLERLWRTWAPRGQRPVVRRVTRDRRALTTAVGLTLAGKLYQRYLDGDMDSEDTSTALEHLRRFMPEGFILILDRPSIPTSEATLCHFWDHPEIVVEPLPQYAPELNPEEYCHGNVKHRLANATPDDRGEMRHSLDRRFARLRRRPDLLLSFVHAAGLPVRQLWLLWVLLLAGCGSTGVSATLTSPAPTAVEVSVIAPPASSTAVETSSSTPPALPTAAAIGTLEPGLYVNPVLDRDFPDPDVLKVGDTYYAYATNSGSTNIQVARSQDLVHWTMGDDALPRLPTWAVQDFGWAWAPDVTTNTSPKYTVGYAVSDQADGPYAKTSSPLLATSMAAAVVGPGGQDVVVGQDGQT